MSNDGKPNKIGFESASCFLSIQMTAEAVMNELSDQLQQIFKDEISKNGNGSKIMVADAANQVKEISKEITDELIRVTVGIDEDNLRGLALDLYVRVMVVLHGNGADRPIRTKPGQYTFKKHVTGPTKNTRSKKVVELPQFEWPFDVTGFILKNAMERIQVLLKDAIKMLQNMFDGSFFSGYVTVS